MARGPTVPDKSLALLEEYIAKKGLRMTRQRLLIAKVMLTAEGHLTIDELHQLIRKYDDGVGYATIYRTVKLLTECGLVHGAQFGDGATRFESARGRDHHDHLICTGCPKIIEFENEQIELLQQQVCDEHQFTMVHHKMEIYGLCAACSGKEAAVIPSVP